MSRLIVRWFPPYTNDYKDQPCGFQQEAEMLAAWYLSIGVRAHVVKITEAETVMGGHLSDCSLHLAPAYAAGKCDCGHNATMNDQINIRNSRFFDAFGMDDAIPGRQGNGMGQRQADGPRAPRPVGRPPGATDRRNAGLKAAILDYGDARQIDGCGEAVTRTWMACLREIGK